MASYQRTSLWSSHTERLQLFVFTATPCALSAISCYMVTVQPITIPCISVTPVYLLKPCPLPQREPQDGWDFQAWTMSKRIWMKYIHVWSWIDLCDVGSSLIMVSFQSKASAHNCLWPEFPLELHTNQPSLAPLTELTLDSQWRAALGQRVLYTMGLRIKPDI